MPKDDCMTPCENDALLSESEVKGGRVSSGKRGVPPNIDVKGRLSRHVEASTPV